MAVIVHGSGGEQKLKISNSKIITGYAKNDSVSEMMFVSNHTRDSTKNLSMSHYGEGHLEQLSDYDFVLSGRKTSKYNSLLVNWFRVNPNTNDITEVASYMYNDGYTNDYTSPSYPVKLNDTDVMFLSSSIGKYIILSFSNNKITLKKDLTNISSEDTNKYTFQISKIDDTHYAEVRMITGYQSCTYKIRILTVNLNQGTVTASKEVSFNASNTLSTAFNFAVTNNWLVITYGIGNYYLTAKLYKIDNFNLSYATELSISNAVYSSMYDTICTVVDDYTVGIEYYGSKFEFIQIDSSRSQMTILRPNKEHISAASDGKIALFKNINSNYFIAFSRSSDRKMLDHLLKYDSNSKLTSISESKVENYSFDKTFKIHNNEIFILPNKSVLISWNYDASNMYVAVYKEVGVDKLVVPYNTTDGLLGISDGKIASYDLFNLNKIGDIYVAV